MLRGIYSAASAMNLSMQKMNLFAQNLSNSQTSGYKKKTYSVHSFEDMMVQLPDVQKAKKRNEEMPIATGSYIDGAGVKQAQGRLRQTGNRLDLAIKGEGLYFQLEVNKGQEGGEKTYTTTRDGRFVINQNNFLVNHNGDYVLDVNGNRIRLMAKNPDTTSPVQNPNREVSLPMNSIRIDEKGQIWGTLQGDDPNNQPAPQVLTTLRLVQYNADLNQPDDRGEMMAILKKYGLEINRDSELLANNRDLLKETQFTNAQGQQQYPQATIHQGYLEESNVDITSEMIMMMMTSKDYDMSQKIISTEDKVLDKTINEMGRLQ